MAEGRSGVRVEPFEFTSNGGRESALSRSVKSPKRTYDEAIIFRLIIEPCIFFKNRMGRVAGTGYAIISEISHKMSKICPNSALYGTSWAGKEHKI